MLEARERAHAEELARSEQKAAEWERAYRQAFRDRELATALAGRPLVSGAAAQLIKLWGEDFDVVEEDGASRVFARDGRNVAQAVTERLASPEYAHFCQPSSRGGTALQGSNRPTGVSVGPASAPPRTLGEAVIQQWRESATRLESSPGPVGLHRRRGSC